MRGRILIPSVMLFMSGCALGGSWRAETIQPQGAPFPINEITFDKGKYTATGMFTAQGDYSEKPRTTTGEYSFNGLALKLKPVGGPDLLYRTSRRWDGRLSMTFKLPNQGPSVTAVLAPVKPAS